LATGYPNRERFLTPTARAERFSYTCTIRYARPPPPGHRNYRRPDAELYMSSTKPNLQIPATRPTPNSDEIDLGYLLPVCPDNRWLIVTATVLVAFIGASYAWLATPEYRGDALLQVENIQSNIGIEMMMVAGQESASASSTQSEILRSRMVMGQAARQAGLDLVVQHNYFAGI